jgi:hypothetical protein
LPLRRASKWGRHSKWVSSPAARDALCRSCAGRSRVLESKGKSCPGGADWQIIGADGFSELDTRYTLETDTGRIVYVQNAGIRHAAPDVIQRLLRGETVDPKLVYFRTVPKFETSAPELQWLTRSVFVGTGERYPNEVVIQFWRVE